MACVCVYERMPNRNIKNNIFLEYLWEFLVFSVAKVKRV